VAEALRAAMAAMDCLNAAAPGAEPAACGEVLAALGEVQAKLTAAHAGYLRRFDAGGAHDADGYGSSSAWLAARTGMAKGAARATVRRMRQLTARPRLDAALAAGDVTESLAFAVADWTRRLPAGMRDETDRIILQAAAAGASQNDMAVIAAYAIETWRQSQPDSGPEAGPEGPGPGGPGSVGQCGGPGCGADCGTACCGPGGPGPSGQCGGSPGCDGGPDGGDSRCGSAGGCRTSGPDDGFCDRYVRAEATFGGAGVIRGDLTAECASAVRAVLQALGKRGGPEDLRTEGQRFHDALQLACELLLRARLVPDRAGADTQVIAVVPLSQLRAMPGAADIEDAWVRARAGEDGYLAGNDARAAACDAQTVPVVTGSVDPTLIDQMIDLARTAAHAEGAAGPGCGTAAGTWPGGEHPWERAPADEARHELRRAIARLAVDLVSGPAGIASALRRGLLEPPYSTPSLPLDIGRSSVIPGHIRRAVTLRDRTCAWPGCDAPPARCDVHHLRHQHDGGETSLGNCALACQFHHDICIHREGWQLTLHPDGTTEARSPDGTRALRSRRPPPAQAIS
jgi:hypothetical protein